MSPSAPDAVPRPVARKPGPLHRIETEGFRFDFFQAGWLVHRSLIARQPVGSRAMPEDECLRFRPHLSMGFPATDVRRITPLRDEDGRIRCYLFDVTFMGLYGTSTPLPLHYSRRILRTVQGHRLAGTSASDKPLQPEDNDLFFQRSPVRDLLDIFHHRILSLFFRSWLKYRHYAAFCLPGVDPITDYLRYLIGCPANCEMDALGISPIRLIRYAGFLTQHPRNSIALEGLLRDYFNGVAFRICQSVGRWVTLPPACMSRLGEANSTPGVDLIAGEQVFDLGGSFDIILGPVDWKTFLEFVPTAEAFKQLRALTRLFALDRLAFAVEIRLKPDQIPELRLTSDGSGGRLGHTTWVRTGAMQATSTRFEGER